MPELDEIIKQPTTDSKLSTLPAPGKDPIPNEGVIPKANLLNPIKKEDFILGSKPAPVAQNSESKQSESTDPYKDFPDVDETFILKDKDIGSLVHKDGGELDDFGSSDYYVKFENIRNEKLYPNGAANVSDPYLTDLFPHEPCLDDIKQGNLGDCYFLAAITSMINEDPNEIKKMIRDNKNGTATVRLFDEDGKAEYYTVDISSAIERKVYDNYYWYYKRDHPGNSFNEYLKEIYDDSYEPNLYVFNKNKQSLLWLEVLRKAYMGLRTNHMYEKKNKKWRNAWASWLKCERKDAIYYISDVFYKGSGASLFFKVVTWRIREILHDVFFNVKEKGEHSFSNEEYNDLYDTLKKARKFYNSDEPEELSYEEREKGKSDFMEEIEKIEKYKSLKQKYENSLGYVKDFDAKAVELYNEHNKEIKSSIIKLIEPLKEAAGENAPAIMDVMKALKRDDKKSQYGIVSGGHSSSVSKNLFNIDVSYLWEENWISKLKNYEETLKQKEKVLDKKEDEEQEEEKLDEKDNDLKKEEKILNTKEEQLEQKNNKLHYKRKFLLPEEKDYDTEILEIYDDIKNGLSRNELLFCGFHKERFKLTELSEESIDVHKSSKSHKKHHVRKSHKNSHSGPSDDKSDKKSHGRHRTHHETHRRSSDGKSNQKSNGERNNSESSKKLYIKYRAKERGRSKGLYSNHAYTILGVGEKVFPSINGGSKTIKTIIIRNPHGKTGRQYEAEVDGEHVEDIFADENAMSRLKDFSSVKAASEERARGNFSTPRKFHDLAKGKDIEGSGIFEMELKDFVYHVQFKVD